MQKLFKFTKLKLIAGYLILLFLATVAIIFIYKETLQLTEKDPKETITQTKLFIISNTLAKLYEAEGIGIAFSQTNSKTKFNRYINLMKEVRRNMDTLKNLTTIKLQKKRIDTINYLLNQKIDNLKALMEVKQISLPEDFYNIAIERVEAIKDSTAVEPEETTPQTITTYDSVYTVKKRKRLYGTFPPPGHHASGYDQAYPSRYDHTGKTRGKDRFISHGNQIGLGRISATEPGDGQRGLPERDCRYSKRTKYHGKNKTHPQRSGK